MGRKRFLLFFLFVCFFRTFIDSIIIHFLTLTFKTITHTHYTRAKMHTLFSLQAQKGSSFSLLNLHKGTYTAGLFFFPLV